MDNINHLCAIADSQERREKSLAYLLGRHPTKLHVMIHEAGHAVVAHHFRYQVTMIDVRPAAGMTVEGADYEGTVLNYQPWPEADEPSISVHEMRREVDACVHISGKIAEILYAEFDPGKHAPGWGSDNAEIQAVIEEWSTEPKRRAFRESMFRKRILQRSSKVLMANESSVYRLALHLSHRLYLNGDLLQSLLRPVKRQRPGELHKWSDFHDYE